MPGDPLAAQLDELFSRLIWGSHDRFDAGVRERLGQSYARLLAHYAAADTMPQRAATVVAFLDALGAMAEVRQVIGPMLDDTRERLRRDGLSPDAAALLEQLPPTLEPPPTAMAVPPDDAEGLLAPAPDFARGEPPPPDTRSGAAAAVAAGQGASDRPPLTRYPDLDYPANVVVGQRTSLGVFLLRQAPSPGAAGIVIADLIDALPKLEVVVWARGFDLEGTNTKLIDVAREEDSDARFVLIPRQLGEQVIKVDFYQEGRRIGTISRATTVVAQEALTPLRQPVEAAAPSEPLEFASANAVAPDLELYIRVGTGAADPHAPRVLYFRLHTTDEAIGYHHAEMGSVTLAGSPQDKLQAVYSEVTTLAPTPRRPLTPEEVESRRRRLASLGRQLWDDLFPDELKRAYWQFKDRVQSLLITSEEPWIPWEMVKPYTFDQENNRVEEPHLCERFALARWLAPSCPAEQLGVNRVRPVAPTVTDLQALQDEITFIEQLGQLRIGVVSDPPYNDRIRVIDLFEAGSFSVLHVVTHANFDSTAPDNSPITLTDGKLRPSDISVRFGGRRPRPLVFINSCHTARGEYGLTGLGGWADRLVREARVAAFIGASWEVNDRLGFRFAEAFYRGLLRDGNSIGESFRLARENIRDLDPANSTWLAYVLYADPEARAVVVPAGGG